MSSGNLSILTAVAYVMNCIKMCSSRQKTVGTMEKSECKLAVRKGRKGRRGRR
jgi:hypothetical protein